MRTTIDTNRIRACRNEPSVQIPCAHPIVAAVVTMLLVALVAGACSATVWGIKTENVINGVDAAPSTLFRTDALGVTTVVGPITDEGDLSHVDALAADHENTLYGFTLLARALGWEARLCTIDRQSAELTVVGPSLYPREIRAAAFTQDGRLFALDCQWNVLLRIDPLTGHLMEPPIGLTLNGVDHDLSDLSDLAEFDGGMIVVDGPSFYSMNAQGMLGLLYTDPNPAPDGLDVAHAGLSVDSALPGKLVAYEVFGDDDIFTYDATSFTRSLISGDIIPSYNAGRGDLAKQTNNTLTTTADTVSVLICPACDGDPLHSAWKCDRTNRDASVTLTMHDDDLVPIPSYPSDDIELYNEDLTFCRPHYFPDATDMLGQTTFSGPICGGGCSTDFLLTTRISGEIVPPQGLPILFNSPDINGDLQVNLVDVVLFVELYNDEYYHYCIDFYYDCDKNLSDLVVFSNHIGHHCDNP